MGSLDRVSISWGGRTQRNAGLLIWLPGILSGPLLDLPGGTGALLGSLALAVCMAAAAVVAVLDSTRRPGPRARVALVVLAAAVVAGSLLEGEGWSPTWLLLAITTPAVLRGRWLFAALALEVLGAVLAAWGNDGRADGDLGFTAFAVAVSGAATTSFLRLMETVAELRRTREDLARVAVVQERERFSRDLHDLLGHTLSVMVVKAEAVRRLAHRDPAAVVDHARDIEQVGRRALVEVREAVDGLRHTTLADELERSRRALEAAGVGTTVRALPEPLPEAVDQVLAWVVREATTNVLRHAAAAHCRIVLGEDAGRVRLEVRDDGVGGPGPTRPDRAGGLDGLRHRLDALGGSLVAAPDAEGFLLTASLPTSDRAPHPATGAAR